MGPGFLQIILVLVVVLILFGAGRLPHVMGDFGKGIRAFKDGLRGESPEPKDSASFEGEPSSPPKLTDEKTDSQDQNGPKA